MTREPPFGAYRRAIYRVDAPAGPIDLRVGHRSVALEALLAERGARRWGFLTAVNPGSIRLPEPDNDQRTEHLRARLGELGWTWLSGRGLDPDRRWPAEPSFLVLDAEAGAIAALAGEFGQAAIVVGETGAPVRLLVVGGADSAQAPPRRGTSRTSATEKEAPPTGLPESSNSTE